MSNETRRIKRGLVGTAVVILMFLAGRGIHRTVEKIQDRREAKLEAEREREDSIWWEEKRVADSIKDAKLQQERQERSDYYDRVHDSVSRLNGSKAYEDSLSGSRDSYYDERDIEILEWAHALGMTMEKELIKTGWPIIKQGEQDIGDVLALYRLTYHNCFTEELNRWGECDFVEELFVGIEVDDGWGLGQTAEWQNHVDTIIGKSDYGDMRKQEISQKVAAVIANTEKRLIANRKAVEERFADYYFGYSGTLGIDYDEGGAYAGYDMLNYSSMSDAVVRGRRVRVYDQGLDIDFFNEPGATYKLVSVGTGLWQVVKTRANGVVERTPVFEDNVSFETYTNFWSAAGNECGDRTPMPKVGDTEFSFRPGVNLGVHIYFDEVTKVEKKKRWEPQYTEQEQRQMDSLRQQLGMKRRWEREVSERKSDSIARALTQRRFGNRGN